MRNEYASVVVAYVTYGIYVTLAGICMYILLQYNPKTKGRYILIAYTCSMFITTTVYFGAAAKLTEISLIETIFNPAALAAVSSKVSMTKNAAYIVNIWLADSLVVYRTYVIWGGNLYVMVIPFIIFIGTVASSIALLVQVGIPGASFAPGGLISDLGTAFLSLSVSSNIISTLLIAGQLFRHQWALRQTGIQDNGLYTRIFAVIAESAALYSGCGLIYIPLYARNLSSQYAVSALYASLGSITPVLIVIRMALGVATNDSRAGNISTMMAAGMPNSQMAEKRETSYMFAGRSQQESTVAASTLSPKRQASKSAQTLADASSDVYPMEHFTGGEVV